MSDLSTICEHFVKIHIPKLFIDKLIHFYNSLTLPGELIISVKKKISSSHLMLEILVTGKIISRFFMEDCTWK